MSWQLLLSGYLVLGTAGYLLQRKLATTLAKHNRLVVGFFFIAVHYPLGLIVAAFSSPNLSIGWLNVLFLLAGSGVFPLVTMFAFRASKDVDAGLYTILINLTPIVTIIAASVLLQENLNGRQLLAAAIIIASAFLATLPRLRRHAHSGSTGIIITLAVVLLGGLAIVYERWMLTRIGFGAYLIFGWGAQTIWMAVLAWPGKQELSILKEKKNFLPILGYSVTNTLRGLCFVAALKLSGNASLVSAFSSFMAVLVVLAAYFVLKEKEWLWIKIGAAAIGTIGLIILNTA